jgi:hypothetical protein
MRLARNTSLLLNDLTFPSFAGDGALYLNQQRFSGKILQKSELSYWEFSSALYLNQYVQRNPLNLGPLYSHIGAC